MSRYISVSKIPYAQKEIINSGKKNKTLFMLLPICESMVNKKSPTRAENNDVHHIESGANSLVLAETAIGKYHLIVFYF